MEIINFLNACAPTITAIATIALACLTVFYIRELRKQARESIKPNLQITVEKYEIGTAFPDAGVIPYLSILFSNIGRGPCCCVKVKVEIYPEKEFEYRRTIYEKFIPYPIPSNLFARLGIEINKFIDWAPKFGQKIIPKEIENELDKKRLSEKLSSLVLKFTVNYTDLNSENKYEKNLFVKYMFQPFSEFEFKTEEKSKWEKVPFNPNPQLSRLFQDYIPLNLVELENLF